MRFRRTTPLIFVVFSLGCITRAGGNLDPITPEAAALRPAVEQTVGDFSFTIDGGKIATSNRIGRSLNEEILKRWVERGYITRQEYVPSSEFTGAADFNLTLSGSQYGESSLFLQFVSGLTLLVLPYTVNTSFDIQYVVENARTGQKFSAAVEDSYHTTVELLLLLAAPIATRGQSATLDAMADHLYEQLRSKGAFDPPAESVAAGPGRAGLDDAGLEGAGLGSPGRP